MQEKTTLLSCKWKFETLFCTNERKFDTFFFLSYEIKYFKSNAINATLSQQNLRGKLLNVGKK